MYGFSRQDNGQSGVTDLEIFSQNPTRSIFVRDLPYFCCSTDLTKFFCEQMLVPILHAIVCKNKKRRTLQFGCVMFESEDHVNLAIEIMNGKRFVGRDIRVMRYNTNSPLEASSTGLIHVSFKALSAQCTLVTEAVLRDSFEAYGDIEHVSIRSHKYSEAGMQGGYGFLTFHSPEQNKLVVDRVRQTVIKDILYDCSWSESHTQKVLSAEAVDFRMQESKLLGSRSTTRSIGAMGSMNAQQHNRAAMHDSASFNGLSLYSDPCLLAAGSGLSRNAGDHLSPYERNRYPPANHFGLVPSRGGYLASRNQQLSGLSPHYNDEHDYLPYGYPSYRGLPSPSTASSSISNYSSLSPSPGVPALSGMDGRLHQPRSAMPPLPSNGHYEDPIALRQFQHHQQHRYFNEESIFPSAGSASSASTTAIAASAARQRQRQQQFVLGQTDRMSHDPYYEPDYDSRMYASRELVGGYGRQLPSQAQEYEDLARFQHRHTGVSTGSGPLSSANLRGEEYEYVMSMGQQLSSLPRTGGADDLYDSFSASSSSLYPPSSSAGMSELDVGTSLYDLASRGRVLPNNNHSNYPPFSRKEGLYHQQHAMHRSSGAFPGEQPPLSLDEYGLPRGRVEQPLDFPLSSSSSVLVAANLHSLVSQSMSSPSLSSDIATQLSWPNNSIHRPQQVPSPQKPASSSPSLSVTQSATMNELVSYQSSPRDHAGKETFQFPKHSSGLPLFFADVPANIASSFPTVLEEELGGLEDDQQASLGEELVERSEFDVADYDDPSSETIFDTSDN